MSYNTKNLYTNEYVKCIDMEHDEESDNIPDQYSASSRDTDSDDELLQSFLDDLAASASASKNKSSNNEPVKLFSVKYLEIWCKQRKVYVDEEGIPAFRKDVIRSIEKCKYFSKYLRQEKLLGNETPVSTRTGSITKYSNNTKPEQVDYGILKDANSGNVQKNDVLNVTNDDTSECTCISPMIECAETNVEFSKSLSDKTPRKLKSKQITSTNSSGNQSLNNFSEETTRNLRSRVIVSTSSTENDVLNNDNEIVKPESFKFKRKAELIHLHGETPEKKSFMTFGETNSEQNNVFKTTNEDCVTYGIENSNEVQKNEIAKATVQDEDAFDRVSDDKEFRIKRGNPRKNLKSEDVKEYMKLLNRLMTKRMSKRDKVIWYVIEKRKIPARPTEYCTQRDIDDAKEGLQKIWRSWTRDDHQGRIQRLYEDLYYKHEFPPKPNTRRRLIYNTEDDRHFLQSLLDSPLTYGPEFIPDVGAQKYIECFHEHKKELTKKLFDIFNRAICNNMLPEIDIKWVKCANHMVNACGCTHVNTIIAPDFSKERLCSIKLNETYVTDSHQLIRTLYHELCHSAAWILRGRRDYEYKGHGNGWTYWTERIRKRLPFLPAIRVRSEYSCFKSFNYRCTNCKFNFDTNVLSISNTCHKCNGPFVKTKNVPKRKKKDCSAIYCKNCNKTK